MFIKEVPSEQNNPSSSLSIKDISPSFRNQSNNCEFSKILLGFEDLGMVMKLCCNAHLSATCCFVLWCREPISSIIGDFDQNLFLASGQCPITVMLCLRQKSIAAYYKTTKVCYVTHTHCGRKIRDNFFPPLCSVSTKLFKKKTSTEDD